MKTTMARSTSLRPLQRAAASFRVLCAVRYSLRYHVRPFLAEFFTAVLLFGFVLTLVPVLMLLY